MVCTSKSLFPLEVKSFFYFFPITSFSFSLFKLCFASSSFCLFTPYPTEGASPHLDSIIISAVLHCFVLFAVQILLTQEKTALFKREKCLQATEKDVIYQLIWKCKKRMSLQTFTHDSDNKLCIKKGCKEPRLQPD